MLYNSQPNLKFLNPTAVGLSLTSHGYHGTTSTATTSVLDNVGPEFTSLHHFTTPVHPVLRNNSLYSLRRNPGLRKRECRYNYAEACSCLRSCVIRTSLDQISRGAAVQIKNGTLRGRGGCCRSILIIHDAV